MARESQKGTLTSEVIAELRAAVAKATPGPWIVHANPRFWIALPHDGGDENRDADAAAVALLRNHASALLSAAERVVKLEAELLESEGYLARAESAERELGALKERVETLQISLLAECEAYQSAERERDEIITAIMNHDNEDMKHDTKTPAHLVTDVLKERDAARTQRDEMAVQLSAISGALMDAATVPVHEGDYARSVRELTRQRDEMAETIAKVAAEVTERRDRAAKHRHAPYGYACDECGREKALDDLLDWLGEWKRGGS